MPTKTPTPQRPQVGVGHHVLYIGQDAGGGITARPAVVTRHLGLGVCDLTVFNHPNDNLPLVQAKSQVGWSADNAERSWKCATPNPTTKDEMGGNDESADPGV